MDVIFTHGPGLDAQQQTVMACRVTPDPTGQQADGCMEVKACGTLTRNVLAWSDGLTEAGVTPVARERISESWKLVDHRLAGHCTVCLVNAALVKPGPRRKTDRAEARWQATRMCHGLW
jgi:hypothetical protein